jgi:hypothetical protein
MWIDLSVMVGLFTGHFRWADSRPGPCGNLSKGKVHPITGREGPEVEKKLSSTLSLKSALVVVGGQRHAPATLSPGKIRYQLYKRLGWAPEPVWTGHFRWADSRPGPCGNLSKGKVKGKVHPTTGREGPEVE